MQARAIENRAKLTKNDAASIRKETEYLLTKINNAKEDVKKTIQSLKLYSENRESVVNDSMALKEANSLLEEVKERHLEPKKQQIEEILDFCTSVLNKTMHMNEIYPEIWSMRENLKILQEKLSELEGYIKRTTELIQKVIFNS